MAQVPYSGAPSVALDASPKPTMHLDVPIAAFGGLSGQAMSRLGQVSAETGNEVFARASAMQQMAETANANKAVADYTMQMGEEFAKYRSLEGKAAVDAYKPFIQTINDMREKVKGQLTSDFAQKAYDSETRMTFSRTIFSAAGHMGDENKKYLLNTNNDKAAANQAYLMQNPKDDATAEDAYNQNEVSAKENAVIHGRDDNFVTVDTLKRNTDTTAARVSGVLRSDPVAAQKMLDSALKAGRIDTGTAEKIQGQIDSQILNKTSDAEAAKLFAESGNKDSGAGDLEEAARQRAEKLFPGNEQFANILSNKAMQLRNKQQTIKKNDEYDRMTTLQGAVYGVGAKDGKLPGSIDELDVKARAAYDNANPRTQAAITRRLATNAKGDYAPTPENQKEYYRLRGVLTDPAASANEREKALEMDMNDLAMPAPQAQQLIDLRNRLYFKTMNDHVLPRAKSIMNPILDSPDVRLSKARNPDGHNTYIGALGEALQQAAATKKAPLTDQEIRDVGMKLLDPTTQPGKIFGNAWPNTVRGFEITPTPQFREQVIEKYKASGELPPDDATIERLYSAFHLKMRTNQFQDIFGKSTNRAK